MHDKALTGKEKVQADADLRGLELDMVVRPAAGSLQEAAALLGIEAADIVKSLVVRHQNGSFLFALIPGDRQISWPKFRALLGVNKLSMPNADVAFEATGYERGTITPLGSTTPWPVYADEQMQGKRISMGAGEHGYSLFVDADALIKALDATVADISDPI
jgi:Cys-tRNA(Pro)/Cys-tRNA(Cys) deacylase